MFDQLAQQYPKAHGAVSAVLAGGEWLRRALILLLVLIIAQILANVFWLLFAPQPATINVKEPANIALSNVAEQGSTAIDLAALQQVALFGVAAQTAVIEEPEPAANNIEEQAVDTKLRLTLKGVMQGGNEDTGGAIIASDKKQQFYSVGDMLEVRGRVKLAKVLPNRVILENSGRYESLWLYDGKWRTTSSASANEFLPGADSKSKSASIGAAAVDTARQDVAARGVDAVNDLINFRIHRRGGQMLGYRISPGKNPSLFRELGLKSGDIVTSVNGIELNAVSNSLQVMKDLRTATSAELMVMRGDEEVAISVNVE